VETFLPVLDFISSGLKKRTEAYSWIENLAFSHVYWKRHPENHWLQGNYKSIHGKEISQTFCVD